MYEITNATHDDSGEYQCRIHDYLVKHDDHSAVQRDLQIQVQKVVPPNFAHKNSEIIELKFGNDANLECNARGNPEPLIQWYKVNTTTGKFEPYRNLNGSNLYISRVTENDEGIFMCSAMNRAGNASQQFETKVIGIPSDSEQYMVIGILSAILCLLIVGLAFAIRRRRQSRALEAALRNLCNELYRQSEQPQKDIPLDQQLEKLSYNRNLEIAKENLDITSEKLGCGNFGSVRVALLKKEESGPNGIEIITKLKVAVKYPQDALDIVQLTALTDELKILSSVGIHPNVLSIIGAVTSQLKIGQLYVVTELCPNGDLLGFLHELRETVMPVKSNDQQLLPLHGQDMPMVLLSFAWQIANGMDYLSNVPCIHRDLATRNVFLTSENIVRIADFGLAKTRHYYQMQSDSRLPTEWLSIETFETWKFSVQSDVWSYGVTLWEIFTLGDTPFIGYSSSQDIYAFLKRGQRLEQPKICSELYDQILLPCWNEDPALRPTFSDCEAALRARISEIDRDWVLQLEAMLATEEQRIRDYSHWRLTPTQSLDSISSDPGASIPTPSETLHAAHLLIKEAEQQICQC